MGNIYAYVRVSSKDQNEDRQMIAMSEMGVPVENVFIDMSLEDIWEDEIRQCDWLYSTETDYFIEASCPVYDDNNLWFARTKYGEWFSMDIQSWWQSGTLDVDGKIFEDIVEFWKNDKYTSEEGRKAIVESYYEQKYEKKK